MNPLMNDMLKRVSFKRYTKSEFLELDFHQIYKDRMDIEEDSVSEEDIAFDLLLRGCIPHNISSMNAYISDSN